MNEYTVHRRLSCSNPIEKTFFSNENGQVKMKYAFCTTGLTSSDATELKTLIQNEWEVQPSCGKSACLSLNPKANYKNGWTANEKSLRKRKKPSKPKPSKPKRRKKSTGSSGKS